MRFETGTGVHARPDQGHAKRGRRLDRAIPVSLRGTLVKQRIRIGHMSGRSNIIWWLEQEGIEAEEALVAHLFEVAKVKGNMLDEEIHAAVAAYSAFLDQASSSKSFSSPMGLEPIRSESTSPPLHSPSSEISLISCSSRHTRLSKLVDDEPARCRRFAPRAGRSVSQWGGNAQPASPQR